MAHAIRNTSQFACCDKIGCAIATTVLTSSSATARYVCDRLLYDSYDTSRPAVPYSRSRTRLLYQASLSHLLARATTNTPPSWSTLDVQGSGTLLLGCNGHSWATRIVRDCSHVTMQIWQGSFLLARGTCAAVDAGLRSTAPPWRGSKEVFASAAAVGE